jgi:penicillin-binding protein 2
MSQAPDSPIVENRYLWAGLFVFLICGILVSRLWYLQIYRGDYYYQISTSNRLRKIEVPSPRGMIFDRHGEVILGNRPFFDLVYIPQYIQDKEKTLTILSHLLHEPISNFEHMLRSSVGRPKFLPITIKRNLSIHEVSIMESNKIFLPGIEVNVAPRRDYSPDTPAHLVGYIGEISADALKDKNQKTPLNPYLPGDLIGKQGLESRWEEYLRGERGYRFIQVDAYGRQTQNLDMKDNWELPIKPAVAGSDLLLSIDLKLQKVAKQAFQGKYGAVVVLNPQNGEILALISSPDFDPTIYQDGMTLDKWNSLISDPYKPLFDKTTGGAFAPGSVYKPVVALAGLQEGVITKDSHYYCSGSFSIGNDIFHCHQRRGHGQVNLEKAMVKSCDVFFYNLGIELGVDRIAKYAKALGLGNRLGVMLNKEDPGLVPTNAWKKNISKHPWALGDIPSLSIGQSANLMTPMQIASLYSVLANGGQIWRPHLVKTITNPIGEVVLDVKPELIREVAEISPQHFAIVKQALAQVVASPEGTGKKARVEGRTVGGKSGSVQVVALKKNRNRTNIVSMKWQEHALFAAFSPVEKPEIVVVIVSENDSVGGGGAAAAPIAGQILNAYWDSQSPPPGPIATKEFGIPHAQ